MIIIGQLAVLFRYVKGRTEIKQAWWNTASPEERQIVNERNTNRRPKNVKPKSNKTRSRKTTPYIERSNPFVTMLGQTFGLNDEAIDQAFREAKVIL